MIPAELQRYLLLGGLIVTSYLMILAWNDDYGPSNRPVEISDAPGTAGPTSGAAPSTLAPNGGPDEANNALAPPLPADGSPSPSSAANSSSDMPDASLLADPSSPAAFDSAPSVAAVPSLVKIQTDTLHMWLDTNGGDIVRVQLPEHWMSIDQPDVPFLLLDSGNGHTYIAQTGLYSGANSIDGGGRRPVYTSAQSEYTLPARVDDDQAPVTLRVELKGNSGPYDLVKSFTFTQGSYLVDVAYSITNGSAESYAPRLFSQIKRDTKEPYGASSFSLGPQPYLGGALTTVDDRYEKLEFEDLDEEDYRASVQGGWIAMLQHYFLSAWIPNSEETNQFYGQKKSDGTYTFGVFSPPKTVAPGATGNFFVKFYAGPKHQRVLEEISPNLNLTVDYGWLWWLAVPLFYVLDWFHDQFGNWGMAIIMLTVVVKLLLYPLSAASFKSMANMKRVAPQLKRLQERYADDRQKLSTEMMALYKKEQVNPLGGCLPMLLPMPIFLALYWVLFESVELRHAPFMLWINDLAAMDPYFVLPILMGATMFGQQMLNPAVGDPMQVRMMKLMPIMFTVLFLFFPAGLVLYWFVNSLLSVAQQWYVTRQVVGPGNLMN